MGSIILPFSSFAGKKSKQINKEPEPEFLLKPLQAEAGAEILEIAHSYRPTNFF